MPKGLEQNDISAMRHLGIDLAPRWEEILGEIAQEVNFHPDWLLVSQGKWWKTGKVGAVNCQGTIDIDKDGQQRPAVLKIQGTKPATSEVSMISSFEAQNNSNLIRPPHVYAQIPWNENKQFEAFVMEHAEGNYIIVNHPATDSELDQFFMLYTDYKQNCLQKPWVEKPIDWSYRKQVGRWLEAVEEQRKEDQFGEPGDMELAEQAINIIEKNLSLGDLEFMHGHFQPGDLVGPQKDGKYVLFSNLFWSWRVPFYDLVFSYHWWMLGMEHAENLSADLLEKERKKWLTKMFSQEAVKNRSDGERLLKLAMLERAVPALMVDRYMMDPNKPSYEIITKATRRELQRLIVELS